jgi:cell division protein FtsL
VARRGAGGGAEGSSPPAGGAAGTSPDVAPRGGGAAPAAHRSTEPVPVRPRLRLVDDRRIRLADRRQRTRLAFVATGLLLVASLFGVVICHAMLVTGQGRLDALEREVVEEQTRYQALRLEVAELEAPGRIVAEAQGRLGMVDPPEITYLTPVTTDLDLPATAAQDQGNDAAWRAVKPLLGGQG